MKKFLLICGISGSGKSYIERKLTEKLFKGRIRFKKMKQVTTRSIREDESQGKFFNREIKKGTYTFKKIGLSNIERLNEIKNNVLKEKIQ